MKCNLSNFYVSSEASNVFEHEVHGVTFKLKYAGATNQDYTNGKIEVALNEQTKNENDQLKQRIETNKKFIDVIIDTIIVGWNGLLDDKDKPIKFTKENAKKLFKDLPDLLDVLYSQASDSKNFINEKK